ncbi:Isoleucine--tRNA ligase [Clarias magur]|uniref:Isoleucine--tRNA ligase n=1 Tax=Clarias magur TaxID=1594786 RepID=A0A8J4T638_CLAMG|nr:Isoleucine--tRNA ligase [Clarias magur]
MDWLYIMVGDPPAGGSAGDDGSDEPQKSQTHTHDVETFRSHSVRQRVKEEGTESWFLLTKARCPSEENSARRTLQDFHTPLM